MSDLFHAVVGVLIPFFGTALGAAAVFFLRRKPDARLHKAMLGFASGIMLAASVWSLLLPSIELAGASGVPAWLPSAGGFPAGTGAMLLLERLTQRLQSDGARSRSLRLSLAVTLHNIPEGMAVGVALSGMLSGAAGISAAQALALCAGIAVQNVPEGAIISMPLDLAGCPRKRAFLCGALSGAVEPLAAAVTIALTHLVAPALPLILSLAAGAMVFVTVDDLIPEAHSRAGTLGASLGFALMMLLDVALG